MPLHPLTAADLELILPWRNAPAVRRAMVSHHEISHAEHRAWFQRLSQDPRARWYLYRDAADQSQGVVYFTALDPAQGTACWGFYAKPDARPGTGILYEALDLVRHSTWPSANWPCTNSKARHWPATAPRSTCTKRSASPRRASFAPSTSTVRAASTSSVWGSSPRNGRRTGSGCAPGSPRWIPWLPPPHRRILILSDAASWLNPYLEDLIVDWGELGHTVRWAHRNEGLNSADFCYFLSYGRLVPAAGPPTAGSIQTRASPSSSICCGWWIMSGIRH